MIDSRHRGHVGPSHLTFADLLNHPDLGKEIAAIYWRTRLRRLRASLGTVSADVLAHLDTLDVPDLTSDLTEHLDLRLGELGVDVTIRERITVRARKLGLDAPPAPDRPVCSEPGAAVPLANAEVRKVATLGGLSRPASDFLVRLAPTRGALSDAVLGKMVGERVITEEDARRVGLAAALYVLADRRVELAAAIRDAAFPRLGDAPALSTSDLATLTAPEWAAALQASRVRLAEGETHHSLAENLAHRFAALHPSVAITARLPAENATVIAEVLGRGSPEALAHVAGTYPGLDLASLFADRSQSVEARAREAVRRIDMLRGAGGRLAPFDPRYVDLSDDSADLKALGLERLSSDRMDQARIVAGLRVLQGGMRIAGEVDGAHALIHRGVGSSIDIGTEPLSQFAKKSGLEPASARRVWSGARKEVAASTLAASGVLELAGGGYGGFFAGSASKDDIDKLGKLPGYQELFGSLSLCACKECQSILGAGAYFVDLMKFIEENIGPQVPAASALHLKKRRADLWELELSCDNIEKRIPTLDIVCEALELYAAGTASTTELYRDRIAQDVNSLRQPFHLPLVRIGAYLRALGQPRGRVASALGFVDGAALVQANLELTAGDHHIITTAETDEAKLRTIYGLPPAGTEVESHQLTRALHIDRHGLGDLVATAFVTQGGTVTLELGKRTGSLQDDIERVEGLTASTLDRMRRFMRLRDKLGWSIDELARVQVLLTDGSLSADALKSYATLRRWEHRLDRSALQIATLFEPANSRDARIGRVAGWLRASNPDVEQMLGLLGLQGVVDVAALDGLIELHDWRSASRLDLDDLAIAMGHEPRDPARALDVTAARASVAREATTSLSFADTLFATALGVSEAASREIVRLLAPGLIERQLDGRWRLRADADHDNLVVAIAVPASAIVSVAATAEKEAATRTVTTAEIVGALRPYAAPRVLSRSLGLSLGLTEEQVTALAALAGRPLKSALANKVVRGEDDAALAAVLRDVHSLSQFFTGAAWDARAAGKARLEFVALHPSVFGKEPLPRTSASGVATLDREQLRSLLHYEQTVERLVAPGVAGTATEAELHEVLGTFVSVPEPPDSAPSFPSGVELQLQRLLGIATGAAVPLTLGIPTTKVAMTAFACLEHAVRLASELGVAPAVMMQLASSDYADLNAAADALGGALTKRFGTAHDGKADEAERPIREAKRDALVDYLIRSAPDPRWPTAAALSDLLLLDVEAGGCATTSRVVSATNSLQLYIHRVLFGLERSDNDDVRPALSEDAIAEWQWRKNYRVWQANRKVFLWPENYLEPSLRDDKTPLFRELESELLQTDIDDAAVLAAYTKYLAGLEEVASLRVAGAYHEIAPDQTGPLRDVFHLFGVTNGDPGIFYYRTCQNLRASADNPEIVPVWSAWQKVDVQIGSRTLSPVVVEGRLHVFWVQITTRPVNRTEEGTSRLIAYSHKMTLRFTTLRPDGTWTSPQEVALPANEGGFGLSRGEVWDALQADRTPKFNPELKHADPPDPIEGYTLAGPNWESVWFRVRGKQLEFQMRNGKAVGTLDLFTRRAEQQPLVSEGSGVPVIVRRLRAADSDSEEIPALWVGAPAAGPFFDAALANLVIDEDATEALQLTADDDSDTLDQPAQLEPTFEPIPLAMILEPTRMLAVPGNHGDVLLQVGTNVVLLQRQGASEAYLARSLGTTLASTFARSLFEDGLDGLLGKDELTGAPRQLSFREAGVPFPHGNRILPTAFVAGKIDFSGAFGVYQAELFGHIPFLIANALNGQGRFAAAHQWYSLLFDPTAREEIDLTGVPLPEQDHRLLDRVWRYTALRGLDLERLKDILSDPNASEAHRRDPFNPWSIARARPTALQRTFVMRTVDNLIEWADSLFAQLTMESVNEAWMLYRTAADLLGERPPELGDCGDKGNPEDYKTIGPRMDGFQKVLIPIRDLALSKTGFEAMASGAFKAPLFIQPFSKLMGAASKEVQDKLRFLGDASNAPNEPEPEPLAPTLPAGTSKLFRGFGWRDVKTSSWGPARGNATVKTKDRAGGRSFEPAWRTELAPQADEFGYGLMRVVSSFCVPMNERALELWDRVADRLFKIRHCQDIDGNQVELALFAPELDVEALVAMGAAGLGIEDVVGAGAGELPPYRFLYLLERAKSFASTLAGFGGAMLAALEKKEGETLNKLRLTQQLQLSRMTTQIRKMEIDTARVSLDAVRRQRESAVARVQFYDERIEEGRNRWEELEALTRHTSTVLKGIDATLRMGTAMSFLFPQAGSPFAMTYGGIQIGNSVDAWGQVAASTASLLETSANAAGFEAGLARRHEGWTLQRDQARAEVASLDRQVTASEIRLRMAERSLTLHEIGIEQSEAMLDRMEKRFTNEGLYTWMAQRVRRLYLEAYKNALAVAKLAERAYRFERSDDAGSPLITSTWDAARGGLLAGEELLLSLQTLERRYLETNYRSLEVDQPFALSQVAPQALVALRQKGTCTFEIDEIFFDLVYPGHYRRRLKSARLTIPAITGPYVNVGATLDLVSSKIRLSPAPSAQLVEVPPSRSVSIATSTAQNDGGVFELGFRDERYMPFEGLGAVNSKWTITLPKSFPQFDYQTINDVILSLSYTADQDAGLRERVEAEAGTIRTTLKSKPVARVFSLRQDFSSAFTRLLRSSPMTPVRLEITERHLPVFFRSGGFTVKKALIAIRTLPGVPPT